MTIEQLLAHFPNLEKDICYKTLKEIVHYLEDIKDDVTSFKSKEEYWNLCIENDNSKEILLLENEFSIMKNEISKKCDWVLFENNDLYFIESKDVKMRGRAKERKDAIKQLIATIRFYNSRIDLSSTRLYSQVCFKSNSRIIKTGDQARKKIFSEYNSDFTEGNYIVFD
jgi:hypothetical protein